MPTPEIQNPSAFELAYQRLQPAMLAIPDSELLPIFLDVPTVIATVLGAEAKLRAYREEIVKLAAFQDVVCIDDLEDAARALMHANMTYQLAVDPPHEFTEIAEKAQALRSTLHSDATALVKRGLFADAELANYRGIVGYKVVAADLALLAGALRRAWPKIAGNTAIKLADLEEANALADALITAVGVRDQSPAVVAEAVRMRSRAFTLTLRYYEDVRRPITYIRAPHGDAEQLAPSLYANRGNGNHKKEEEPVAAPAPVPSAQEAPKASAAAGMPGEDPFAT